MYLNASLPLSLMPRSAALDTRQGKVELFAQKFIPLLINNYKNMSFQNRSDENPPKVRIFYSNIMCLVMFDRDNKYSLNWYINNIQDNEEYKNVDMNQVGQQMMLDAQTYFRDAAW